MCVYIYIYNFISADPGLRQGRGGAWDHRRCGTSLSGRKQRHTPFQGNNSVSCMPRPSTCPCQLFFTGFKTAVCPASNFRKPFQGKTAVCPASNPPNAAAGLQATCPCHLFFRGLKTAVCPASNPPNALLQLHAPTICFSGGSRPPRQQHGTGVTFAPKRGSHSPLNQKGSHSPLNHNILNMLLNLLG